MDLVKNFTALTSERQFRKRSATRLTISNMIAAAVCAVIRFGWSLVGIRHTTDDKLLETALMGAADCLVTGDRDLLEMSPFQNIPILSPADFLRLRTVR